jgi:hypothetical protein
MIKSAPFNTMWRLFVVLNATLVVCILGLESMPVLRSMSTPIELDKVFATNSSCCNVFDLTVTATNISSILQKRPPIVDWSQASEKNISLVAVNFGPGTTGTHAIHEAVVMLFNSTQVHHYYEPFTELIHLINQCIMTKHKSDKGKTEEPFPGVNTTTCKSSYILSQFSSITEILLTRETFVSDTPISILYPDLVMAAPHLLSVSSYRDAESYVPSRLHHHRSDLICPPSLWSDPTLLHPFDIIACLRLTETVSEAVMFIANVAQRPQALFADAYRKLNSVNTLISGKNNLHLCMHDIDKTDSVKIIIGAATKFLDENGILWGYSRKGFKKNLGHAPSSTLKAKKPKKIKP